MSRVRCAEELRDTLNKALLPPGRVLTCTPFGIHELEALLAVAERANAYVDSIGQPDDRDPPQEIYDFNEMVDALDILFPSPTASADQGATS